MKDDDDTERSKVLISTEAGWRTEMVKWIFDTQKADYKREDCD
jgi:hypothetical protein